MANKIVVDPVTRIEGHLRIEAVVENGKIVDAYSGSKSYGVRASQCYSVDLVP